MRKRSVTLAISNHMYVARDFSTLDLTDVGADDDNSLEEYFIVKINKIYI